MEGNNLPMFHILYNGDWDPGDMRQVIRHHDIGVVCPEYSNYIPIWVKAVTDRTACDGKLNQHFNKSTDMHQLHWQTWVPGSKSAADFHWDT